MHPGDVKLERWGKLLGVSGNLFGSIHAIDNFSGIDKIAFSCADKITQLSASKRTLTHSLNQNLGKISGVFAVGCACAIFSDLKIRSQQGLRGIAPSSPCFLQPTTEAVRC